MVISVAVATDTDGPLPNGVKEFLDLPGVGLDSKKKIVWDNCRRLYGFDTEAA